MNKIILILAVFAISCAPQSDTKSTQGVITQIVTYKDSLVYVEVEFAAVHMKGGYYPEWFIMPDTVRVGQIINLK